MRRLELRSAILTAVLALPSSAFAAPVICRIDGVEATQSARDAGFTFKAITSTATRCELSQSTIIVAAPQARDVVCDFIIFGGKKAEDGWSLQNLTLSSSDGTDLETIPKARGWLLKISAPRAQTSRVNIRRLSVRGDDCLNWRKAFSGD